MKYGIWAGFIACIIGANYATTEWGEVASGFGYTTTAGAYFAGLTFVLRDSVQARSGVPAALGLIAVGAVLSLAVADPRVSVASGLAFAISETVDLAIYTPLRRRGYLRAAIASNAAGALVDTVVFLAVAGFPVWGTLPGQMLAKVAATAAVVAIVLGLRGYRRAVSG